MRDEGGVLSIQHPSPIAMPTVLIPALLRSYSGGRTQIQVPGETLRQVFDNLDSEFPGIRERIVEDGRIRPEISIAVDNELVDTGLLYRVDDSAEIVILPAISGG
ncbi:MAG: MoaD/ThiS family protein [Chloroflexi bacterium]|nr:MoaD/ThiS family protein [Chloroflexota bacterium]